jgi:hypothetical protein
VTHDLALSLAWLMYGTQERAVVELLLLSHNATDRETRFKAMRALEWFDPATTEEPARPAIVVEPRGPVDEAIECLRWVLYGWEQSSRARAAARAGELITELAANA